MSAGPAPPLRGNVLVHSRKEPGSNFMALCMAL